MFICVCMWVYICVGLCASVCARNVCVPSVCACVCICRGVVLVCVMYKGVKAMAGNRFQNEAAVFSLHKKGSKRGRSRGEEYLSKRDKGTLSFVNSAKLVRGRGGVLTARVMDHIPESPHLLKRPNQLAGWGRQSYFSEASWYFFLS